MRKYSFLLLFTFLFSLNDLSAQTETSPDALSWRWTWTNFQYPITKDMDKHDYTTGAEITYGRYLNRWLNLAIPFRFGKADLPTDDQGNVEDNELIGSLDAILQFNVVKSGSSIQPYLLGGAGIMRESGNDEGFHPELPVGIGLNLRLTPGFYLSAETQYRVNTADNRNQLMHAVGMKFDFGIGEPEEEKVTDTDNDGIPDTEDQCPTQAGSAALFGCPDADGDGVADKLDDCPNESGLAELGGCPDTDGDKVPDHLDECPTVAGLINNKGCPTPDRDGDGVPDSEDLCPDAAGSKLTKGCPDLDGDGVADKDDQCPSKPGLPINKGCPDTDQDGVIDPEDKCPNTAGPASNFGCPELKEEEKETLKFAVQAIQFETGSANLKASSNSILNKIADIMNNHPEQKLRISGYTDSIGSAENNEKLSQRRAKACFDYLVSRGVAANRMTHQGFGETNPIADNKFSAGREQNRRVEFDVYIE